MKKIVLLFTFLLLGMINLNAQTTSTFTGGGDGNSWSDNANWDTPPASGNDINIPSGYDCVIDVSSITVHSIMVDAGASLSRGFGGLTTNATVNVTGDITCNGTIGLGGQLDRLTFNFDGASQTISGSGTFDVFAFKKSTIASPATNLVLNMDVTLRTTSNALNSFKNGGVLDVTVNKKLDVTSGYISIDNLGAASGGTGSVTVGYNGILNVAKYIDVFADNTTNPGNVSFVVDGIVNVPAVNFKPSVGAGSAGIFTINAGGKLYLTGSEPFAIYSIMNNTFTKTGEIHFSALGNQTISNVYSYNKVFFEGSGTKTLATTIMVRSIGSLTLGGTATISGYISYATSCTLIYAGTAPQITGPEIVSDGVDKSISYPANITINNGYGVTLDRDISIDGTITFENGNLYTTSLYGVTVTGSDKVANETSNHYLVGNLRQRTMDNPDAGDYLGLVTDAAISGTSIMVTRVTGQAQVVGSNSGIKRYWTLAGTGISYAGNLTLNWLPGEAAGMQMSNAIMFEYYPSAPHFIFMNDQNGVAATLSGDVYSLTSTIPASAVNQSSITYTVGDKNSPLPVELTSFAAAVDKKGVTLNWETSTEVANHGFDVERALVNTDGKVSDFAKLGFVNGNGNSNSPKSYSFIDNKAVYGKYVYRLKQIDNDGKFSYSQTTEVEVNNLPTTFVMEQNYPNPFNPSTTIRFSVPKESFVNIAVYNMLGQKVATVLNETMKEGAYEKTFNASNLSSGNYVYVMTAGDSKIVKKMTLVK
jgi:hypothetical protein